MDQVDTVMHKLLMNQNVATVLDIHGLGNDHLKGTSRFL